MDTKRVLSAVVVLTLTVGCAWASTEVSRTAGFTVVPDNEAAQIAGGSDGRACNIMTQDYHWYWCDGTYNEVNPLPEWDCYGSLTVFFERWACGDAESGQCENNQYLIGWCSCSCVWYPESQSCSTDGYWSEYDVWACQ